MKSSRYLIRDCTFGRSTLSGTTILSSGNLKSAEQQSGLLILTTSAASEFGKQSSFLAYSRPTMPANSTITRPFFKLILLVKSPKSPSQKCSPQLDRFQTQTKFLRPSAERFSISLWTSGKGAPDRRPPLNNPRLEESSRKASRHTACPKRLSRRSLKTGLLSRATYSEVAGAASIVHRAPSNLGLLSCRSATTTGKR